MELDAVSRKFQMYIGTLLTESRPVMQVHSVDFPKGTRPASHQVSALLFLGSDMSVGINGAILPVDGGWSTI